ncbi:hypothetical protein MLD38_035199 [Melastoma candidum]|uniref:Uncharacterized protein n=1 Tax=Melastoma candidum TaxID=119954 RepID=A0ACB9MC26_9MYRT|nr:hypothetical protein MLD38_035199 [Melastoma candidum]
MSYDVRPSVSPRLEGVVISIQLLFSRGLRKFNAFSLPPTPINDNVYYFFFPFLLKHSPSPFLPHNAARGSDRGIFRDRGLGCCCFKVGIRSSGRGLGWSPDSRAEMD